MIKNNKDLYKELLFFINICLISEIKQVKKYNEPYDCILSIEDLSNYCIIESEKIGVSICIFFADFGLYIFLDDDLKIYNLEFLKGENSTKIFRNREPLTNITEVIYNFLKTHNKEYPSEQFKEKIEDF